MNEFSRRRLLTAGGSGTALTLAGCLSLGDSDDADANGETDADANGETDTDANGETDGDANGEDGTPGSNGDVERQDTPSADGFAVTVAADIDQESAREIQQELRARQQEIRQQVEAGEIDQEEGQAQAEEAQQEAQQARLGLIRESVGAIEETVAGREGIEVTETATDSGLLLVGGSASPILGLLEFERTAGILAEEEFDALQQSGP